MRAGHGIIPLIDPKYFFAASESVEPRNTLAYRLAEMFAVASKLYGPRHCDYSFSGIEFVPDQPRVRFSQLKSAIILIQIAAMYNETHLLTQLAHESIHLLAPSPERPVKILEEGMAECFAYLYLRDTMGVLLPPSTAESYREAAHLVGMLLALDPDGIRKIRAEEPIISHVSRDLILKYYPTLPLGVAARLTRTFVADGCDDPYILRIYEAEGA